MLISFRKTPAPQEVSYERLFDDLIMVGPKEKKALPSIFYFALTGKQSCTLSPINQPVAFLSTHSVRIFSWSLFAHQEEVDPKESMKQWASAIEQKNNFIEAFITKSKYNLSKLIDDGWVDSSKIAVSGLSRGAFLGTHWAANDSRISVVVGYSPLVSLNALTTFPSLKTNSLAKQLNLINSAPKLIHKKICFYMGNRDQRVSTEESTKLVKEISNQAYQKRIRSPQVSLMITPSIGYLGHGTSPSSFYSGTQFILEQFLHI
jgi:predicted esterase